MDPLRVLTAGQGFFTRGQARELGYDDRAVVQCVRATAWFRIRRGYYVFPDEWQALDEAARHRVRSHAVLDSLGEVVALSHVSGVIEHGISVWGMDLTRVHVTRLDGGPGRIEGDVVHHEGRCSKDDVRTVGGRQVVAPQRCVLEAGSRAGAERALIMLDSGLFLKKYSDDELCACFDGLARWPFMRSMHIPVRLSHGGAQSAGESRGRYFCWAHRLPAPLLQHEVWDGQTLVGTTDWAWPDRGLLGEFDGRVKYGRLLAAGQSAGDVVFAEKQREDLLRETTGWRLVRVVWDDYERPGVLESRLRRALGLRAS